MELSNNEQKVRGKKKGRGRKEIYRYIDRRGKVYIKIIIPVSKQGYSSWSQRTYWKHDLSFFQKEVKEDIDTRIKRWK